MVIYIKVTGKKETGMVKVNIYSKEDAGNMCRRESLIFDHHSTFRYAGDFKESRRTGKGLFSWPDGSSYDGEWESDKR
jgi:hypothetical protein